MRLPDFVVLGQGKAGTSLIYRTLAQMPDIGLSTPKELHYFSVNYDKGRDWYADHFKDVAPDVAAVGEVSPSYLRERTVDRIAETLGRDIRVIYILRKPVEQNYARYIQNICATRQAPAFHVRARPMGRRLERAEKAVLRAQALFGPDRVLALSFETDVAVPEPTFATKIRAFLGLAPMEVPPLPGRVNRSVMPRYLYGGEEGFRTVAGPGQSFWVPAKRLIFCAQDRNSMVWHDPDVGAVSRALADQSQWSLEVPEAEYARLQEAHVIPAARRMMDSLGIDLSHWIDAPPRRLAYAPAPPPPQFLSKDQGQP